MTPIGAEVTRFRAANGGNVCGAYRAGGADCVCLAAGGKGTCDWIGEIGEEPFAAPLNILVTPGWPAVQNWKSLGVPGGAEHRLGL